MSYLSWHYLKVNEFLFKLCGNYILAIWHFFSIDLLLKHLFSPWRRVKETKTTPGFSFNEFFERLTFNLVSRLIGFLVRVFLIGWGIVTEVCFSLLALIFLFVWQLLVGLSLPLYWWWLRRQMSPVETILKETKGNPWAILQKLCDLAFGKFVFERLGVDLKELEFKGQTSAEPIKFENAASLSDLFFLLAREWPAFTDWLSNKELKPEDILVVGRWFEALEAEKEKQRRFWEKENLMVKAGLGWDFAFGYTPNLDRFVTDLTKPTPFFHQLVGRDKEVNQIEEILARREQSNVLLVGEPGVGKRTIVLGFAKKVKEGKVRPQLVYKRVLELDLDRVIGAHLSLAEAKTRLKNLLLEAEAAGNVILVIFNLEKFTSKAEESLDLTDVFIQIITSRYLQVIGVVSSEAFHRYLSHNEELLKIFEKIEVEAPEPEEALTILMNKVLFFERGKKIKVTYQALKEIIKLSERLITEVPFPEKAIDLLDEALSRYQGKKPFLTLSDIDELVSEKLKVPVGTSLAKKEEQILKHLEDLLKTRIIGQEEALKGLASALRRRRLAVGSPHKPIGSFLFLGPTGVGKTETAKALAEVYFGGQGKLIRLDMSQYQQPETVETLIGSSAYGEGLLVEKVKSQPFSVLLLDELEKAHPKLLNIFLTILDEGYFQDYRGKKISFENLIIIATSNAAAEFIREKVKEGLMGSALSTVVIEHIQAKGWFSPEFINRFDGVVVFKPLTKEELSKVAKLQLEALNQRLQEKEISLVIDENLIQKVVEEGYSAEFGCRPMKRWLADHIEDALAKALLAGTIKKGDQINFSQFTPGVIYS